MLNPQVHKTVLVLILKSLYSDPDLRSILGFKGGTAAYLFYDLPRFSVDLDFDLLDQSKRKLMLKKGKEIFKEFGQIDQAIEKRYTLFFLINYRKGQHSVKVEISKRASDASFEIKHYLGIPTLVMKREDMAAGKLAAFLTRKHFASRDMFDLWFFLKNGWLINKTTLREKTGLTLNQALTKAEEKTHSIAKPQLLQGLGELIDTKQKFWVKEKLKGELLFQLQLYKETYSANQ